jgi:hypothetical protein
VPLLVTEAGVAGAVPLQEANLSRSANRRMSRHQATVGRRLRGRRSVAALLPSEQAWLNLRLTDLGQSVRGVQCASVGEPTARHRARPRARDPLTLLAAQRLRERQIGADRVHDGQRGRAVP